MKLLACGLSLLLLSSPQSRPASAAPPAPSRDAILTASRTIIANARYAALVTPAGAGQPDARIVDPFAPDADFTIWVATNSASRKAAQLARDPRVTLIYFDAPGKGYVTLKGTAALVGDAKEKSAHWKNEWTGMYANKNAGDDYLLVRITPDTLEVVSVALGMINDPVTWRPVTLKLR